MPVTRTALKKISWGLLLAATTLLLTGCGYKGPLTLPEQAALSTTTHS